MTKRYFISFSLRMDATEPLSAVTAGVERALGCTLERGEYQELPAMVGDLLGVRVGLLLWRGIGGAHVYQLHGLADGAELEGAEAWEEIPIDDAVLDLLHRHGATSWRKPHPGELMEESQYDLDDI